MYCPVCDIVLSLPLPEFCPNCNKKLKRDITLIHSLDKVPEESKDRYLKWLGLYRKFFKAKVQLKDIVVEFSKIKGDFKVLKEETFVEIIDFLEFNINNSIRLNPNEQKYKYNESVSNASKAGNGVEETYKAITKLENDYKIVNETKQIHKASNKPENISKPNHKVITKADFNYKANNRTDKKYKEIAKDSINIHGRNIYNDLKSDKYKNMNKLKSYLEDLKVFDNPKDIFDFKIYSPKTFSDNNGDTILSIETNISLNMDSLRKARNILVKYKDILYKDGKINYLTKKISGNSFSNYGIRIPMNLVLLDENEDVLEVLEKRTEKIAMDSFFTVYNTTLGKHNQSIFRISMLDIPKRDLNAKLIWNHKISDETLKSLKSVKFIFREKSLLDINYEEKYDDAGELYYYQPKGLTVNILDIETTSFYNKQINQMIETIKPEIEILKAI